MRRFLLGLSTLSRLSSSSLTASSGIVRCYNPTLALRLGLQASPLMDLEEECGLIIQEHPIDGALELVWGKRSGISENPFRINFCDNAAVRRQSQASKELSVKSIGKADMVIDLTAGLGRDSIMLASSGRIKCHVTMVERNIILFHLLSDAVQRLQQSNPLLAAKIKGPLNLDASAETFVKQLQSNELFKIQHVDSTVHEGNSPRSDGTIYGPDIAVYMDPMYPQGTIGRRSKVKKETQMLHRLLDSDLSVDEKENNAGLFAQARSLATTRIVVKRPLNAPPIDVDIKPHECIQGSTQRFDVYLMSRMR